MINLYCIRPKGFNIGNDVIYLGLNHFIRSAFGELVNITSFPATSKYESHKKAGLTAETVYEVNQFGNGLIIGGGNLYENGELAISPTALKALEVPLMLFSLARGKIFNKRRELVDRTDVMTDENIIRLNRSAQVSISRDKATHGYLSSIGCDTILGGCPTIFINEMPQHMVPTSERDRTDALISIRMPSLMSIPIETQYRLRDDLLHIIDVLRSFNYRNIKLLCHDHRDIPYASSFTGMEYLYTEDPYVYLTFLKNTRLCVTYRLHSFLPCMAFDIPAAIISYDQRTISMVDTIGLDQWNIHMLKDDVVEEVRARLRSLDDLAAMKTGQRKTCWPELRQRMVSQCKRFAELVREPARSSASAEGC
jgi:hypothetical protein